MSKLSEKIKEEVLALIPPTVFFLLTLSLVAVIRVLMLKGTGLPVSSWVQIAVGALILGKAVVIADLLPFINRYPAKPLAYNIAWKTMIYTLVALVIHYLERLIDFWKDAGGFVAANQKLLTEIVWPHFWAIQIVLVVLIFNYCTLHELVRAIGADKARALFFGPPRARA
jgi:phosphate/sulfate permease